MKININFMDHLPGAADCSQAYAGDFCGYVITNLRKLSPYLQYNQVTETASVLTVNLGLIHLSDRLINIALDGLNLNDCQSFWCETGKWCFKGTVLLGGLSCFNNVMNLQLTPLYLLSSAVATLALQVLWQKIVQPILNEYKIRAQGIINEGEGASAFQNLSSPREAEIEPEFEDSDEVDENQEKKLDDLLPKEDAIYRQVATELDILPPSSLKDGGVDAGLLTTNLIDPRVAGMTQIRG